MSRVVAGTLLLPNGQPMANASIYFTAKRTEAVSIIEGSNTFFTTNNAGVYNQTVVNGWYAVSIEYIADSSGAHTRRWPLGDVFIEDGAASTLQALIIASNPPSDLPLTLFYEILADAQQAAADAQAAAIAAAASAASIAIGTAPTNVPNNTILNARLGTTGNLGTLAQQNANAVAVSGGAIDGTTVGATTRSAGRFTSVDASLGVKLGNAENADPFVMDWYEEGISTPTVVGAITAGTADYSVRLASWQRRGNRVKGEITIAWSDHSGAGGMIIVGLPFPAKYSIGAYSNVALYSSLAIAGGNLLQAYIEAGGSSIYFDVAQPSGVSAGFNVPVNSGIIMLSYEYEV